VTAFSRATARSPSVVTASPAALRLSRDPMKATLIQSAFRPGSPVVVRSDSRPTMAPSLARLNRLAAARAAFERGERHAEPPVQRLRVNAPES
jgi:hypothetical protein